MTDPILEEIQGRIRSLTSQRAHIDRERAELAERAADLVQQQVDMTARIDAWTEASKTLEAAKAGFTQAGISLKGQISVSPADYGSINADARRGRR